MINRLSSKHIKELASVFKVVAVTGPRQSGKTTLVKNEFPDKPYVNLETPANRLYATDDPVGFLSQYPEGAILDEAQNVPHLFSYLQEIVDNNNKPGMFILTGSNNFLLNKNISQSLAGRVAYVNLLPFNYPEIKESTHGFDESDYILNGFYPPVYDQNIPFSLWYPNYIRSYIERDVRQIKNINNLVHFERFIRLLAGFTGQELNYHALSVDLGIDIKTVQSWIAVLEQSFIVYLLKPYYKNYNKTITKRPKLFFYDTGIVCSLLGITSKQVLNSHPLKGAIFETFVVSEFIKHKHHLATTHHFYYWRDKTGREIDLIIEHDNISVPAEIKSGKTVQDYFFKGIRYWLKLTENNKGYLVYAGNQSQKRSDGIEVINWKNIYDIF
jgi:predicted AAA+ superfamily ATPase